MDIYENLGLNKCTRFVVDMDAEHRQLLDFFNALRIGEVEGEEGEIS